MPHTTRVGADHVENEAQTSGEATRAPATTHTSVSSPEAFTPSRDALSPRAASPPRVIVESLDQTQGAAETHSERARMPDDGPGASPHRDHAAMHRVQHDAGLVAEGIESAAWRHSLVQELDARDALARESVRAVSQRSEGATSSDMATARRPTNIDGAASVRAQPTSTQPLPPYAPFPLDRDERTRSTRGGGAAQAPHANGFRAGSWGAPTFAPTESGPASVPRRSSASGVQHALQSRAAEGVDISQDGQRLPSAPQGSLAVHAQSVEEPHRRSSSPASRTAHEEAVAAMMALRTTVSSEDGDSRSSSTALASNSPS